MGSERLPGGLNQGEDSGEDSDGNLFTCSEYSHGVFFVQSAAPGPSYV